jgi:hypothetical protein
VPQQQFYGDQDGEPLDQDGVQGPLVAGGAQGLDARVQEELVGQAEQQQDAEDDDLHPEHPPVHGGEQLLRAVDVLPDRTLGRLT